MSYYTLITTVADSKDVITTEVNKGSWVESINTIGDDCYITFGKI